MDLGISGLSHVGFTVSDLERSKRFYMDGLGFTMRREYARSAQYFADIVGYPSVDVAIAHLNVPGTATYIELFEYRLPTGERRDLAPANIGNAHICLEVEDIDALHDRLPAYGARFISAPVQINAAADPESSFVNGGRGLYMIDPDGIHIELWEVVR